MKLLYTQFANAVYCISSTNRQGDEGAGTAFHVGDGLFVTARHAVAGRRNVKLLQPHCPETSVVNIVGGPWLPKHARSDVCVVKTDLIGGVSIPVDEDLLGEPFPTFNLCPVLVMGFPRIPMSRGPSLVALTAEVSCAGVQLLHSDCPHFVLANIARGGLSGAPVLTKDHGLIAMMVESLLTQGQSTEEGLPAAISLHPMVECLNSARGMGLSSESVT